MSYLFPPDRSLLYPQFETYRLHSLDPDTDLSAYPLPGPGATQSRVGYNTHLLSFKETRARISWDHLTTYGRRGLYVDAEWNIIGFYVDDAFIPQFTNLGGLPIPISSSEAAQHPEYPSILALSSTIWLVASGAGSLYVLETSAEGPLSGRITAQYDLNLSSSSYTPFVLQAAYLERSIAHLLISRSVPQVLGKRKITAQATTFELLEATIDIASTSSAESTTRDLSVVWTLQGGDAPFSCKWSGDNWLILSSEAFKPEQPEVEETEEEREKREKKERIEKLGLGASLSETTGEAIPEQSEGMEVESSDPEEKEWPYEWTQTSDSVSISIPLPEGTSRNDISLDLTSETFSLAISMNPSPVLAAFLAKPSRQFWTAIDPSMSTWTFDPKKRQIDIELAKVDLNTRWPSVFAPSDDDDDDDDEEDVPETLSQAMLDAVKASFSNIHTRSEGEPTGNHPAIPALLREEMEYDLEDGEDFGENETGVFGEAGGGGRVGMEVYIGTIVNGVPSWSKAPTTVISLPLPGVSDEEARSGIMVKSAVDGLLFSPKAKPSKEAWQHISTSPALSFVLSSKRDIRLVRHLTTTPSRAENNNIRATVLAFDAGGSGMASGNVYVYYPPTSGATAKQGVVRVSGGDRGALLGVGEVGIGDKRVIVALCEKSLVVLHNVL